MKITDLVVTPIAFRDPPLLNADGVHEPLALRTIVQLVVGGGDSAAGVIGLGEGSGERRVIDGLAVVRDSIIGKSVFDLNGIERAVNDALGGDAGPMTRIQRRVVYSIIDVACHDAQGKIVGIPVSELLGGTMRTEVDFSAYLFYKWGAHPGASDDEWGAALDPAGIVAQARQLIDEFGFGSIKLKAGVFPPEEEIAAIRALADAFPGYPLRIDPNGAWTVETSLFVAEELQASLEYLEDPTLGLDGMSAVARGASMPLATNMCVVSVEQIRESVEKDSVQIILSDHHYWGGLRHTRELSAICETFGLGMSMHSNSHLGISLAAMTHVAAASPHLSYACDTHYPWNRADDIVVPGVLEIRNGALRVPSGPGLGVELDLDRLEEQHAVYVESGRTTRDDTSYMRLLHPEYDPSLPRF